MWRTLMASEREDNRVNPRLRAAFLEVVENQIRGNDPPETRETLQRLLDQGMSEKDAKLQIAQAVSVETFDILKHHRPFNRQRYVENLRRLPEAPRLRMDD